MNKLDTSTFNQFKKKIIQCRGSSESYTQCTTRGAGDEWKREGKNSGGQRHEIWKGEGDGVGYVHRVNKMDTAGTFRKEIREF